MAFICIGQTSNAEGDGEWPTGGSIIPTQSGKVIGWLQNVAEPKISLKHVELLHSLLLHTLFN